jgi:YggT family protein
MISEVIRLSFYLYIWVVVLDWFLSFLPQFENTSWRKNIRKLSDYSCLPVRKVLPKDLTLDLSRLIVVISLKILVELW